MAIWRSKSMKRFSYNALRRFQSFDENNLPVIIEEEFVVENCSSFQPVTSKVNDPLPSGFSEYSLYKIYTTTPLVGVDEYTGRLADIIYLDDEPYIVVRSKKWSADVQSHYEVYVVKDTIDGY